ncbi:MAG: hypothetical protein JW795_07415, partial [Chitinivibrionales bacterium]|nr:hypothetical protein [Chitinivibrionales bacterium]
QEQKLTDVHFESVYQLQIEDSHAIRLYHEVIFIDATREAGREPFAFTEIAPCGTLPFSSHALQPQQVLSLCGQLFNAFPRCYTLAIPGYAWQLQEQMSVQCQANAEAAVVFLQGFLRDRLIVGGADHAFSEVS